MFGEEKFLEQELTSENIFKYVSDYEIFRYYCGNFDIGKRFKSPLRKDNNASFAINKWGDFFYWKDFSSGQSGNCFTFVMNKFGCDYRGALQRINLDFNLNLETGKIVSIERTPFIPLIKEKEKTDIKICSREWQLKDINYWSQFGITVDTLNKYKVKPITNFWINGHYYSVGKQLAFSYEFPDGYKLYFPEKKEGKWFTNSRYIQGLRQLDKEKSDLLIISKSLKEVLLLHECGFKAIAPQSEHLFLSESLLNNLKQYFSRIVIYYDNDTTGIKNAESFAQFNNLSYIYNPIGEPKDFSDLTKKTGKEYSIKLLNKLLNEGN